VAADKLNGLRGAADSLNHQLTKWLKTKYSCSANIVSVDFFLSTDLIRTAIQCNLLRSRLVPPAAGETSADELPVVADELESADVRSPLRDKGRVIRASVLIQSEDESVRDHGS
jgi:hypothetical protein